LGVVATALEGAAPPASNQSGLAESEITALQKKLAASPFSGGAARRNFALADAIGLTRRRR
jgi:hypothetical protein